MAKLLIADFDEGCRLLLEAIFGDRPDLFVQSVRRGDEALDLVKAHRPDVVILEGLLYGINGFSLCEAIKSDPATASTKVVMLTVMAQEHDRQNALASGVDLYVTKPFSPYEFERQVFELLAKAGHSLKPPSPDPFPRLAPITFLDTRPRRR